MSLIQPTMCNKQFLRFFKENYYVSQESQTSVILARQGIFRSSLLPFKKVSLVNRKEFIES